MQVKAVLITFLFLLILPISYASLDTVGLEGRAAYLNGSVYNGTYNFTFRIFNDSSNVLLVESNKTLTLSDGYWFTSMVVDAEMLGLGGNDIYWNVLFNNTPALAYAHHAVLYSQVSNNSFFLGGQNPSFYLDDTDTYNTTEEMQDAVMSGIDDGTQTGISVTYQDASNDMDFVVDFSSVDECSEITNCVPNAYNSLSDLQSSVSNDFHNLGGVDVDTWNTSTEMISAVNGSFLEIDDQRYNNSGESGNTSFNQSLTDSLYPTKAEAFGNDSFLDAKADSLNSTKGGVGTCPSGEVVMNITSGGPECVPKAASGGGTVTSVQTNASGLYGGEITTSGTIHLNKTWLDGIYLTNYIEIDPLFSAVNSTIFGNDSVLNAKIDSVNTSDNIANLGFIMDYAETDPLFTALNTSIQANLTTKLNISGGTMTGDLSLGEKNITTVDCIVWSSGATICG